MNPPSNPDNLSLARLLCAAIRLASSRHSKAKAAFRDQVAARDPDLKCPAISPFTKLSIAFLSSAVLTGVAILIVAAAAWGGLHLTPWMAAALDNYRCSRSQLCEPIAIRAVSTTALPASQWTQAFALENAEHRDDKYFLLDADLRAKAAAREKSDAAISSEHIRQLAKRLAPSRAAAAASATLEASQEPTALARVRLAISGWTGPALFVFFMILCIIFLVLQTVVARLDFHRPELEKAAEIFELESTANRSLSRQRGPRRSGRL